MAITYNEDGSVKKKKGSKIAMDIFPTGRPPKDIEDQLKTMLIYSVQKIKSMKKSKHY